MTSQRQIEYKERERAKKKTKLYVICISTAITFSKVEENKGMRKR